MHFSHPERDGKSSDVGVGDRIRNLTLGCWNHVFSDLSWPQRRCWELESRLTEVTHTHHSHEERARKRHINFEHIHFWKSGQPAGEPEGKVYISWVSRRTHKVFGPINPGTTNRLSQGHLDVNQSKRFVFMCLFLPERRATGTRCGTRMLIKHEPREPRVSNAFLHCPSTNLKADGSFLSLDLF